MDAMDTMDTYLLTRDQLLELGVSEVAINRLPAFKEPVQFESVSLHVDNRSAIETNSNAFKTNDLPNINETRKEQEEESEVTMDSLPELPFELILGYLSLEERIKCRPVSQRWCKTIDRFRVESLCCSARSIGFISEKNRWASGAFARNFIKSTKFDSFFSTFGQSILSTLKHLHLCDLHPNKKQRNAIVRRLDSFGQLEELALVRVNLKGKELKLNLPTLKSIQIHLEREREIEQLTLNAPKLQSVKIIEKGEDSFLRLNIVHAESVEVLVTNDQRNVQQLNKPNKSNKLKNLKYLYVSNIANSLSLPKLKQLKEIHLDDPVETIRLFQQKQRHQRADLKIFYAGCLVDDPDLPFFINFDDISRLTENHTKLANEIPFHSTIHYGSVSEGTSPDLEINVANRLVNLQTITINSPIQNSQRFLNFIEKLDKITTLEFLCGHPQDLFDRLPDHCASVQKLCLDNQDPDLDFGFLFKLYGLIRLEVTGSMDAQTVRKLFETLPFLSHLEFMYGDKSFIVKIRGELFEVMCGGKKECAADLNTAIYFIAAKTGQKI